MLSAPPPEERLTEGQSRALFQRKAQLLAPLLGRAPLDFSTAGKPVVSVVMVVRDRVAATLATLASLRCNLPGDVELILVDSGSTDETRSIARYVRGAQVIRFDANVGALRGGNAALHCIRADAALFLHNVTLGENLGEAVQITSGLAPGDKLVNNPPAGPSRPRKEPPPLPESGGTTLAPDYPHGLTEAPA